MTKIVQTMNVAQREITNLDFLRNIQKVSKNQIYDEGFGQKINLISIFLVHSSC